MWAQLSKLTVETQVCHLRGREKRGKTENKLLNQKGWCIVVDLKNKIKSPLSLSLSKSNSPLRKWTFFLPAPPVNWIVGYTRRKYFWTTCRFLDWMTEWLMSSVTDTGRWEVGKGEVGFGSVDCQPSMTQLRGNPYSLLVVQRKLLAFKFYRFPPHKSDYLRIRNL